MEFLFKNLLHLHICNPSDTTTKTLKVQKYFKFMNVEREEFVKSLFLQLWEVYLRAKNSSGSENWCHFKVVSLRGSQTKYIWLKTFTEFLLSVLSVGLTLK